ncbi:MAG: copper transporter [Firmicutes bacterium]|nr:copper transporter [Bacillota bacterium]
MPLDFRYYISSLAAIFLALGIGIAIGGALMNNGELTKSQEQLIINLEQEFEQLRKEKKNLQAGLTEREVELEVLRQFNREVLPLMVSGLLRDRKIGIIKTNHTVPTALIDNLIKVLKLAGAEVPKVVAFNTWPDPGTEHKALAASLGLEEDPLWLNRLLAALAVEVVSGQAGSLLASLQAHGLIQINEESKIPLDTLILLGGSFEEKTNWADQLDLVLAKELKRSGVTVAGVEPLTAQYSYIPKYKNSGLLTIDNIDTFPGQVALILALAGGEHGHFGVKATARNLLPKLPGGLIKEVGGR